MERSSRVHFSILWSFAKAGIDLGNSVGAPDLIYVRTIRGLPRSMCTFDSRKASLFRFKIQRNLLCLASEIELFVLTVFPAIACNSNWKSTFSRIQKNFIWIKIQRYHVEVLKSLLVPSNFSYLKELKIWILHEMTRSLVTTDFLSRHSRAQGSSEWPSLVKMSHRCVDITGAQ